MSRLHADFVLTNGRIAILDRGGRFVEALAARDGRIVALGRGSDVGDLAGPDTETFDLEGRTAIPGIVDSHCHPDSHAARIARWHDLSPANIRSRAALLARIDAETRALGADEWFVGYRLNERGSGGYPSLAELDGASNGRPVFVLRTDGHIGLANSRAFAACGIASDAPDPPFGQFDRHPDTGVFTGLVRETAAHVFLDHVHRGDTAETWSRACRRCSTNSSVSGSPRSTTRLPARGAFGRFS